VNKELADSFGNFVNRSLSFVAKRTGSTIPAGDDGAIRASGFVADVTARVSEYRTLLQTHEYRKAVTVLRGLWSAGNVFWEQSEPWKMEKGSVVLDTTMRTAVHYVRLLTILSSPFIPSSADTILERFGESVATARWPDDVAIDMSCLAAGMPLEPPPVLFRKIEDTDLEAWSARFGAG
jgi:methionyl-tRNA synthetase